MTPTAITSGSVKELDTIGGRVIVSVSLDMYNQWKEDMEMYASRDLLRKQLQDSLSSGIGSLKI